MKKFVLYLLTALLCLFVLAGCAEKPAEAPQPPPEFMLPTLDDVTEVAVRKSGGGTRTIGYNYTKKEHIDAFLDALLDTTPVLKEKPTSSSSGDTSRIPNGGSDFCSIVFYRADGSNVLCRYFGDHYIEDHGDTYYFCELKSIGIIEELIERYLAEAPCCLVGDSVWEGHVFTAPKNVIKASVSQVGTRTTLYEFSDEKQADELLDIIARSVPPLQVDVPPSAGRDTVTDVYYIVELYAENGEVFTYAVHEGKIAQDDSHWYDSVDEHIESYLRSFIKQYAGTVHVEQTC